MSDSGEVLELVMSTYTHIQEALGAQSVPSDDNPRTASREPIDTAISQLPDSNAERFAFEFSFISFLLARESLIASNGGWLEVPRGVLESCARVSGLSVPETELLLSRIRAADGSQVEMGLPGVVAAVALPHYLGVSDTAMRNLSKRVAGRF